MFRFIKDCEIEKIDENDILELEETYMFKFPYMKLIMYYGRKENE